MWKKWRPAERVVLILAILFLLAIGVFPVVELLFRSLVTEHGLSFVRYEEIFSSHRQVALLLKTIGIALGAVTGALLLGVPYAFFINKIELPSRRLLAILGFLPLLLSPHVQVVSWVELYIQVTLRHPDFPFDIYSPIGAIFIESLTYFPLVYLIMFFGLRSLDRTMEEASYLARGATPTLFKVVFPLVRPYVFTSAIFVFLFSLSNFGMPSLLRVQVFSVEVLYQLASYNDVQKAAATSAPFVLLGILAVLTQWFIERRMRLAGTAGGHGLDVPRRYSAGALTLPIAGFCWAVALVTFLIPIAVLIWQAGAPEVYIYSFKQGIRDIGNSLILAIAASTLTGLIGALVAIAMRNSKPSVERTIDIMALLPFALPPSLLGIKLILIWNQGYLTHFLYPTILMSVLAFFTRFITFPVKIMYASMRQMDPYLEEAAQLANVAWWKNLWLLISMNARGFWASWLIVYILVHGELGINLLIDPPGFNTLTTRIFNLFHYGRVDVIASLSLISVVMLAVPFLIYMLLFQRKGLKSL